MGSAQRVIVVGLIVAVWGAAAPARAALGVPESSVDGDARALAMERRAARPQAAGVRMHELRAPTQAVREFADASGRVFGVAWNGIAPPDLPRLLGAYYGEYRTAASRPVAGRGPRRVDSAGVVVEFWGHGRDLHGRAWVPALLPQGASLDDLR